MLLNRLSKRVSILIAAIHRYLHMHACMEVTERYHSQSFFLGLIMQLPLIQLSGNKAEIFMQITQFISDTFSHLRAVKNAALFPRKAASGSGVFKIVTNHQLFSSLT